jgi:glutamate formiminotransferase
MIESVINISEGRRQDLIAEIAASAGEDLLDVHSCVHHNRSVITVVGESAPRAITAATFERLDLTEHAGAHPRIGVVDVVPFIALGDSEPDEARGARDAFAAWAAEQLSAPVFLYGPLHHRIDSDERGNSRTLPEIRRRAFGDLPPDLGPETPHHSAGAIAVGCRPPLVAYNLWLGEPDLALAKHIASSIRSDSVRALGLAVGDMVQVSINLIDPTRVGPADVHRLVAAQAPIVRAELVGLLPAEVLARIDAGDWELLDLAENRTIEWQLTERERRLRGDGGVDGAR